MKKFILSLAIVLSLNSLGYCSGYFENGKKAFNSGNYQSASTSFFYALKEDPYDVNARYYYAMCFARMGQYSKAIPEFKSIIKIDPYSQAAAMSKTALSRIDPSSSSKAAGASFVQNSGIDNYYSNAVNSNGMIIRWDKSRPIRIFVQAPATLPSYYAEAAKAAFATWSSALNGYAMMTFVSNIPSADIVCSFTEGAYEVTQTGYTQGVTKPVFGSNNTLKTVEMKLSLKKPNGQAYNEVEIYNTALHEAGHALGIWGHSQNQADIMYGFAGKNLAKANLTPRDKRTMQMLYQNAANITNTAASQNIDRAIASNKGRFDTKLNEALNYVKKNPHSSMSYLHLAETYVNMKDYNNAILSYRKALSYDPQNAMIYNKIGYCYEMKRDMNNAYASYQKAISMKPSDVTYSVMLSRAYASKAQYAKSNQVINTLIKNNPLAMFDSNVQIMQKFLRTKIKT